MVKYKKPLIALSTLASANGKATLRAECAFVADKSINSISIGEK